MRTESPTADTPMMRRLVAFLLGSLALLTTGCTSTSPMAAPAAPPLSNAQPATQMFHIPSKDGTLIALECAGSGPTLIMVHGGIGDRRRWTPMFPLLAPRFTVCAMDRRGRGGSGDSPVYALSKEAEDVAAVANSRTGTVFVFGHSYGAVAALEASFLTDRIAKLILYEPPVRDPAARGLAVAEKVERLIQQGQREEAVVIFQTEIGQQSPAEIAAMRSRPNWQTLVATIDSHPRQMRALAAYKFDAERMRTVQTPTLLLIGSDTKSPHMREAVSSLKESLPNSKVVVLEGQQHNAMDSARELLAEAIVSFLSGGRRTAQ
jgi:pimeloyl-ACP methyl ester carboxylesterase